ncbi:hypothetical protein ACXYL9_00810 [Qipengyuania sp. CAU 1752]
MKTGLRFAMAAASVLALAACGGSNEAAIEDEGDNVETVADEVMEPVVEEPVADDTGTAARVDEQAEERRETARKVEEKSVAAQADNATQVAADIQAMVDASRQGADHADHAKPAQPAE